MLEKRLRFHFRTLLKPTLGLGPYIGQRITSRPPRMLFLQGIRASVHRQIPGRRLPMHACLHCRVVNHTAFLELVH
jgi:hypothetical protein